MIKLRLTHLIVHIFIKNDNLILCPFRDPFLIRYRKKITDIKAYAEMVLYATGKKNIITQIGQEHCFNNKYNLICATNGGNQSVSKNVCAIQ